VLVVVRCGTGFSARLVQEPRAARSGGNLRRGASRPLGPADAQRYHHCRGGAWCARGPILTGTGSVRTCIPGKRSFQRDLGELTCGTNIVCLAISGRLKCAEAGSPSLLFSQLLEEAIGLDPTNSMALADLAFARHFEAVFGRGDGPAESHARLGEAARKELRPMTAMPWRTPRWRSLICFPVVTRKRDARLRRALDLDPNSMFARGYLGGSYAFGGDYDAALSNLDEALRLRPRGPLLIIWHLGKGWAALVAGHDEEAAENAIASRFSRPPKRLAIHSLARRL
jgi:hypothetical protein